MNATANYVPSPTSVELHLSSSPEFSRHSKKVKALGGRYSECRGHSNTRFVTLPWTPDGVSLANLLVALFGRCGGRKTTMIVRGVNSFRGKHVHAPVVVHYIDRNDADPCGALFAEYEAAFLRAFPEAVEPEPAPAPKAAQADPEDEKNVTLTVSLNEARTILASLNRRVYELESLGGPQCAELVEATKSLYQSIDGQVFCES